MAGLCAEWEEISQRSIKSTLMQRYLPLVGRRFDSAVQTIQELPLRIAPKFSYSRRINSIGEYTVP
jgi:hypothetical protein